MALSYRRGAPGSHSSSLQWVGISVSFITSIAGVTSLCCVMCRSEYEISQLAGHYGVPEDVGCIEDTGDIDELRQLKEEYVACRGQRTSSASVGFWYDNHSCQLSTCVILYTMMLQLTFMELYWQYPSGRRRGAQSDMGGAFHYTTN